MIKAGRIVSAAMCGNIFEALCETGTLRVVPYADNVVRVAYYPGEVRDGDMWGIVAEPDADAKYTFYTDADGYVVVLGGITVRIGNDGVISFVRRGKVLTKLKGYSLEECEISGEATYHVNLSFTADDGESFYGLGQHQDGVLDLAGREHVMWHDYSHKGGEIVAVPYLISGKKYGILFDNVSRGKVSPGVDGETAWWSEVGEYVSFFFVAATETDDLYRAFRLLSGETPLPPKSGLGFIQCKQRYESQAELMEVAEKYAEKGYPVDIFVVDWFHWKQLGDMSLDTRYWPDSAAMNKRLAELGYESMITTWPRYMNDSYYYQHIEDKGWFMKDADGKTVYGAYGDWRGALIDTTDPECGEWYFSVMKQNYADLGYKYWWTDEDEPDISPHEFYLHAGTGARVNNLFPLTHTKCIYEGHRQNLSHRCLTLSRASWTGAQKYGTTFWSSDIFPEWDVLRRQIPTALNFCASGMPYWSSDIGGWQPLPDDDGTSEDYATLLIATQSEGKGVVTRQNFAELFVRWFEFGVFCPTFRTHGTRKHNEVWSYGEDAEEILVKYLRLRYRLMPYIYSLARRTNETGAPFMRALWMDFDDEGCKGIADEFMFGPAMLIAPVYEQGAESRKVYLPAGHKWYDYWTNEVYDGGCEYTVDAPIGVLPIFVRAGSIIPTGEDVPNTKAAQKSITVNVYRGGDCEFELYFDDGVTYDYENGDFTKIRLTWNEADEKSGVMSVCGSADGISFEENVIG